MGLVWCCKLVAALSVTLFIFHGCCFSHPGGYKFLKDARSAAPSSVYDYIIIGGGTAGCPLAATLSLQYNVLLLERGGSPYGNPNITQISAFGAALSDLAESSPSQRFVSEDGVINARARVLGGATCLNAGFYTRASSNYVREARWDERLVNRSYEWVEDVVAFRPPVRQWQSALRDSLLEVGVLPNNGFTFDHIDGTKVSGSIFDAQGQRHTAADLLKLADPEKLTVLLHATVHKILFINKGKGKPKAHGVAFRDSHGVRHTAYLKDGSMNEIIVSAGALGSPHLLMLSGVGPEDHLKAHNISVVLDQPNVGQGMSDNPMNAVFVPSPVPVEVSLVQVVGISPYGTYIEGTSGESFTATKDYGMFSPKIGQLSTLPPKQRTPEAISKAIEAMSKLDSAAFQGGFMFEKIEGPLSRGHLELTSINPNDNPRVTFNYFNDPQDLEKCIQGIKIMEKIIDSKAFSTFKYTGMSPQFLLNLTAIAPINLLPRHLNTSTSPEQFCRDTVMTIWHYHGGCQVGRVVDLDYRVVGVDRLRVVDGSTFNFTPGTNPQATVMMLGRYVGIRMLNERLANEKS